MRKVNYFLQIVIYFCLRKKNIEFFTFICKIYMYKNYIIFSKVFYITTLKLNYSYLAREATRKKTINRYKLYLRFMHCIQIHYYTSHLN